MVWRNNNGSRAQLDPEPIPARFEPAPDESDASMRKRVLVVDDDLESRTVFEGFLSAYGYETLSASDGVEALALLEHEPVDLVILDLNMPRMTGYELMRRKRALPSPARDVPVIICSAAPSQFIRGVEAVFVKPLNMLDVLAALDRTIGPGKSWPQRR